MPLTELRRLVMTDYCAYCDEEHNGLLEVMDTVLHLLLLESLTLIDSSSNSLIVLWSES